MTSFEVEIKSLLGSEENAQMLRERMKLVDPTTRLTSRNTQLNHYFMGGDLVRLIAGVARHISADALNKLKDIALRGREFSVRTRHVEKGEASNVLLVLKASVGEDSSSNGVTRMEFEEKVSLSLDELDQQLLDAGFQYQAKWSRQREEYVCKDVAVCLDRNAGYGWLAEFEKVVQNEADVRPARHEIRDLMQACGVQELQQERLERMFAFYNAHWGEYYGTDKVFTVA